MKKSIYLFIISLLVILSGCKSTQVESDPETALEQTHEKWPAITSLSALEGKWQSEDSYYEYPFVLKNGEYLLYASEFRDDTQLWLKYAENNNLDVNDLWQKRFACIYDIYKAPYPYADENGVELGLKLKLKDGLIYSFRVMLIPSKLLLDNKEFFRLSPDGKTLAESGIFKSHSSVFPDKFSEPKEYQKVE